MSYIGLHPLALFPVVAVLLFLCGFAGYFMRVLRATLLHDEHKEHLNTLTGAVLAMLGLLLGFTFSMAVGRYDTRKTIVVDEANAIGTTWLRTSLLDQPMQAQTQNLLRDYLQTRIDFYDYAGDPARLSQILNRTSALQTQLWTIATNNGLAHRDAVGGLFISTLNDVIDLSEKRTAARENRIPTLAWTMLYFISASASFLLGFSLKRSSILLLSILPLIVGCAFALILDLDSPTAGLIRISQASYVRLQQQMTQPPTLP